MEVSASTSSASGRARRELLVSISGNPFDSRKAAWFTYATQSEDRLSGLQRARLKAEDRVQAKA